MPQTNSLASRNVGASPARSGTPSIATRAGKVDRPFRVSTQHLRRWQEASTQTTHSFAFQTAATAIAIERYQGRLHLPMR